MIVFTFLTVGYETTKWNIDINKKISYVFIIYAQGYLFIIAQIIYRLQKQFYVQHIHSSWQKQLSDKKISPWDSRQQIVTQSMNWE